MCSGLCVLLGGIMYDPRQRNFYVSFTVGRNVVSSSLQIYAIGSRTYVHHHSKQNLLVAGVRIIF